MPIKMERAERNYAAKLHKDHGHEASRSVLIVIQFKRARSLQEAAESREWKASSLAYWAPWGRLLRFLRFADTRGV